MQDKITRLKISNPEHINKIYKIILDNPMYFWNNDTIYTAKDGEQYTFFNKIFFNAQKQTFKVISNYYIFGCYKSYIFPIEATFVIYQNTIYFVSSPPEVVKIIKNTQSLINYDIKKFHSTVLYEYIQSTKIEHLGINSKLILNDEAYIFMRKMPGTDLVNFISIIDNAKIKLPVSLMLSITYAILISIRDQVTKYNLVHMDIKLDNLILDLGIDLKYLADLKPTHVKVNCIDYAFSHSLDNNYEINKFGGTYEYLSPEFINNKFLYYKEKPDVYSAGIVIQILWRFNKILVKNKILDKNIYKKLFNKLNINYIDGLSENIFQLVCILTVNMVKTNPNHRYSLEQAIKILEYIIDNSGIDPNIIYVATTGYEKSLQNTHHSLSTNSLKNRSGKDSWLEGREFTDNSHYKLADSDNNKLEDCDNFQISNKSFVCFNNFSDKIPRSLYTNIVNIEEIATTETNTNTQNSSLKNRSGNIWPFWRQTTIKNIDHSGSNLEKSPKV